MQPPQEVNGRQAQKRGRRCAEPRSALRCAVHRQKQVDGRLAVEDANKRFYDAFMSGDIKVRSRAVAKT